MNSTVCIPSTRLDSLRWCYPHQTGRWSAARSKTLTSSVYTGPPCSPQNLKTQTNRLLEILQNRVCLPSCRFYQQDNCHILTQRNVSFISICLVVNINKVDEHGLGYQNSTNIHLAVLRTGKFSMKNLSICSHTKIHRYLCLPIGYHCPYCCAFVDYFGDIPMTDQKSRCRHPIFGRQVASKIKLSQN